MRITPYFVCMYIIHIQSTCSCMYVHKCTCTLLCPLSFTGYTLYAHVYSHLCTFVCTMYSIVYILFPYSLCQLYIIFRLDVQCHVCTILSFSLYLSARKERSWVVDRVVIPADWMTPDDTLREQMKRLQIYG